MAAPLPTAIEASGLPILPLLPRIEGALASSGALVLQADPGAGKTTIVPPALLGAPFLAGSGMLVLEPRRIAAVAAAARISDLLGERLGETAGYSVRLERRVSSRTRIEIVTEGLAVRRIIDDPGLRGIGLVILDEFHERSVHADLALALLLEARVLRPDLRILVMSATLDAPRIAAFVGCPSLLAPGRAHPVDTRWEPAGGPAGRFDAAAIARSASRALAETGGDVLVFLAGAREMRRVRAELERGPGGAAVPIADLHGMMSLDEQREVIEPRPGRPGRIVLATNVAETSLTVPGVRAVVDSGFVRLSRFHPRSGMNRLVTERVSAASADQRRGRAGRLGPGLCVRCWDPGEPLEPETEPEMLRAELSATVLAAALWGAREAGDLRLLDPPPPALWQAARELLRGLGAIDAGGAPTARGKAIARAGLEPRLGAVVEEGARAGSIPLACACAALLATRDDARLREDADFRLRLDELRRALSSGSAGPEYSRPAREYAHLVSITAHGGAAAPGRPAPASDGCGALVLAAFPDRLAQRLERGLFRLVGPLGPTARRPRGGALCRGRRGRRGRSDRHDRPGRPGLPRRRREGPRSPRGGGGGDHMGRLDAPRPPCEPGGARGAGRPAARAPGAGRPGRRGALPRSQGARGGRRGTPVVATLPPPAGARPRGPRRRPGARPARLLRRGPPRGGRGLAPPLCRYRRRDGAGRNAPGAGAAAAPGPGRSGGARAGGA